MPGYEETMNAVIINTNITKKILSVRNKHDGKPQTEVESGVRSLITRGKSNIVKPEKK